LLGMVLQQRSLETWAGLKHMMAFGHAIDVA